MKAKKTIQDEIKRYYLKGLTAKEIGKLTDISARSVQRHLQQMDISEPKKMSKQLKALQLHESGFSYSDIAKKFGVCKTTVFSWCKQARTQGQAQENNL